MQYLDASAVVKLAVVEAESDALGRYLTDDDEWVSSSICFVEAVRNVTPHGAARASLARHLLDRMRLVSLDDAVLETAGSIGPSTLRSLDAIHIATALTLGAELDALVTYDRRMQEAAVLLGIPVAAPA